MTNAEIQCDKVLKSFVPKVESQPWMPPILRILFWTMSVISGNNTRMNSVSCEYSRGEWQQCWEYNSSQISKFGLNVWIQKNIPNLFKGATNYSWRIPRSQNWPDLHGWLMLCHLEPRIYVYLDFCTNFGHLQPPIRHTLDC